MSQHDIAKYCKAFSKQEVRQGKRNLSGFLAQGDFFSGGGKIGYHYQDKNLLSEVEFDVWEDREVQSWLPGQRPPESSLLMALGHPKKRPRTDCHIPQSTHAAVTPPGLANQDQIE